MSVQISGVFKDGAGKPVQGCTIQLNAKKTSPTVVVEVISSTVTDANLATTALRLNRVITVCH